MPLAPSGAAVAPTLQAGRAPPASSVNFIRSLRDRERAHRLRSAKLSTW